MHRTWRRLGRIMGAPSTLVLEAVSGFDVLINAMPRRTAKSDGELGVWASTGAVIVLAGLLLLRYHRQVASALAPSLDRPGSDKLTDRRGAVVIVGLDSADPGTTFLRLLATATNLEYVA